MFVRLQRNIFSYENNVNSLFSRYILSSRYRFECRKKKRKEKRPKRIGEPTSITSFTFSRCINRSASWIPSRDRPREYRLSWPLDTIPDPFAITRMHRTQRQCFETIRDCRLRGVTSTCTYTCTHADTSTSTLSLLLRCCTLLRVRVRSFVLPRTPCGIRERRHEEVYDDISVLI